MKSGMNEMFCVCVLVAQSCPTLCNPMDCNPPGSTVHGVSQARLLEQVAISFFRGSSQPSYQTHFFCVSCIAGKFFTPRAVGEAHLSHEASNEIKWQPTPVFLPGESHGQRNLEGHSPWGHKSRTPLSE